MATYWDQVVEELEDRFPVLRDFRAGDPNHPVGDTLPDLLKITAATALQTSNLENGRIAVVLPRLGNASLWVALATVLARMQDTCQGPFCQVGEIPRGAKVLVDGIYIGIYEGETSSGFRVGFATTNQKECGRLRHWITFRKEDRLRLQPTTTNRPLSALRNLPRPTPDALDSLLGFHTFQNRSLFDTYVILVTTVTAASEQLRRIELLPDDYEQIDEEADGLADLIQWGVIRKDGEVEIKSVGQKEADPVLLLAPDLMAVRNHARKYPHVKPLVMLDGSARIDGYADVLADVLDEGRNTVAFVDHSDREVLKPLANSGFNIWAWSREDVHHMQATESKRIGADKPGSLFSPMRVSYYNYARQNIVPVVCAGDAIQQAAERLMDCIHHLDQAEQDNSRLEGHLYHCLLELARMVRPLDSDAQQRLCERVARLRLEIKLVRMWLSKEGADSISDLLNCLDAAIERGQSTLSEKVKALHTLLEESRGQSVAVLVSNTAELDPTRRYWTPYLNGSNVRFFDPTTIRQATDIQHLILPGWLGASRMSHLLDGCLASRITLLVYPFEQTWLRTATRKWNAGLETVMSRDEKASLLSLDRTELGEETGVPEKIAPAHPGSQHQEPSVDITDFELRLNLHRRTALVEAAQGQDEEQTEACFVRFADGYYAFLTRSRRLPVVTGIILGEEQTNKDLPRKTLLEMKPGDYVVFRNGSQSDVLRELADSGLQRAGLGHLREVAGEWRAALREYVGAVPSGDKIRYSPSRLRQLVDQLAAHGIDRTASTIRFWISDDSTIGPDDYRNVVPRIAEVTGNKSLKARAKAICDAIEKVKSAHLSAAAYLKERLFAALPGQLEIENIEPVYHLDLEGIGSATIVRVEEVSGEAVSVAPSRANLLLWEED